MTPQARIGLSATATALTVATIWLLVRWFHFTESFGIRLTEEVIIALVGGLIFGGMAASGYETWKNQRDHGDELAELCSNWGFTFSKPLDKAELGSLAASPLLQRYTQIVTRMSGTTGDVPVEMLDVSRWVQRANDTNDRFEWRHTLVLFPAPTDLPAFAMFPLTLADRYLNAAVGAKGITFEHAVGRLDEGISEQFHQQYFVWPADRSFLSSCMFPSSETTRELGEVFSAELITYLAEHPGWCVEVGAGQVAMWRDDRIEPPAARELLLADAVTLYVRLTNKPVATQAAVRVRPEVPFDYRQVTNNWFRLFIGVGIGIWVGFAAGAAALFLLLQFIPNGGDGLPYVVFPGLLGCMVLGAYLGYRVARRFSA
jgi:hypothetical protein